MQFRHALIFGALGLTPAVSMAQPSGNVGAMGDYFDIGN